MTKREKLIMNVAVEIDRLLTDGIEIHPNSPIHEKLNQALRQPVVTSSKPKSKSSKKEIDPEWFSKWCDVISRFLCKHNYLWVRNVYGDEIYTTGKFKRSWWKCNKCGKWQSREQLYTEGRS